MRTHDDFLEVLPDECCPMQAPCPAGSELVHACAEHWRAQGVDIVAYNTNSSADDLEDGRLDQQPATIPFFGDTACRQVRASVIG